MKSTLSVIAAASALAALSACGGGGDNSHPVVEPVPFHVSTDNQVGVTRAALVGGLAVSNIQTATDAGGASAQPSGLPSRAHALADLARRALAAGVGPRMAIASASVHPAAASSGTEACGVSGSVTTTFDDRDGNLVLSTGDVLTIRFTQCRDSTTTSYDGTAVITLTSVPSATQITASAQFQALTQVVGGSTSTVDGGVTIAEVDSDTASDTTLTVGATGLNVTLASSTFHDVVGFGSGTRIAVDVPAAGDRFSVSLDGTFSLQSVVYQDLTPTIQTISPLVQLATDAFPSSGVLKVIGNNGLLLTVLDATTVQMKIDDGDGNVTSTATVPWATLIP